MFAFVQTAFTYIPDLTWQQIAANAGWSDAQPVFYHKFLCKYIERLLPADGSPILDVGCGNGFVANYLADKGYNVYGIDASLQGVAIANRTGGGTPSVSSSAT